MKKQTVVSRPKQSEKSTLVRISNYVKEYAKKCNNSYLRMLSI